MTPLLVCENVTAGYGAARVLRSVSLTLGAGKALAVLGRNGTGKTTLVNSIIGVTDYHAGRLLLAGRDITRLSPVARARAGIGWVPQERNIFKSLTVEENLTAVARPDPHAANPWNVQRAFAMFPRLRERRRNLGNQLSGGEQQMLAICRALMLNPCLLLLDEPTEGLAPIIVTELMSAISNLLHEDGLSAIIVEQQPVKVLKITDAALILDRGSVVHAAASADLLADPASLQRFLSVDSGAGDSKRETA